MLKYFSRYGEVIDCVVMKNQTTGKSRGFGFVTFRDPLCMETVLLSGPHILDGRQVATHVQSVSFVSLFSFFFCLNLCLFFTVVIYVTRIRLESVENVCGERPGTEKKQI